MTSTSEKTATSGKSAGPLVELDDVSKFYGNIKALEHVSLEV
ncbi:sugar ABC transporter ATP-binding protein, partial [Streptomyces sp. SID8455]|nr:sugar ABC transporter ATP-binding protein [Streptomyces sp. SID8455]